MTDLAECKRRLARFAEYDAAGASPLYEHLASQAAADDEIVGLLTRAPAADAQATLLLAAAHRLIQADPIHPLSRYYPSLGGTDGVDAGTWPLFREFLLERADQVRELVASRVTQTNEVRRAAVLYPAVAIATKQAGGTVALLEAGCSAGLLLDLDKYAYRYQVEGGEQLVAGPAKAAVGLHCALEAEPGADLPKPPKKLKIGARIGLDRAPVDLSDEDELAWLEACVWADQVDRIRLLRTAAAAQQKAPPELVAGDVVDDLPAVATRLAPELPLVVLTSSMLPYLERGRREEFIRTLREISAERAVWWVAAEDYEAALAHVLPGREDLSFRDGTARSTLSIVHFAAGEATARPLARTSPHGQRMTWLAGR